MVHSPEVPADVPSTAHARAVLRLVIVGSVLVVIDIVIVTVGLPDIQADLGGSPAGVQWVIIAYTLTMGAVTQVVGTLSDRLGRRNVYLVGVGLFTASSLACGLAPTIVFLDVARGLQGIGGAVLMANSLPLIAHAFEGQRRNMAIATWGTAATAAGLVAPVLGGVLIDTLTWRAMFFVNVPIGVVAFVLAATKLPSPRPDQARSPIDWMGTGLLIVSLGLATFTLLRGEDQGWGTPRTLIQFGLAATTFALFVLVQRRAAAPTLDLSLFRRPAFTGAVLAVFMSRVLTIGGTVYLVQYFQGSLHLTPTQSGLMLMPGAMAQMGAGMLGGRLQDRFAPGPIIATGYTAKAVAAAWLGVALSPSALPWTLAIPLLVWGFGGGLAGAPVMSVAMNVDKRRTGMVGGTITSLASIGGGVGTAVLGALYNAQTRAVLAGDEARPGVQAVAVLDRAVAGGASAVLLASAVLALITATITLALINSRSPPT